MRTKHHTYGQWKSRKPRTKAAYDRLSPGIALLLLLVLLIPLQACELLESDIAELWTDIPELALYAAKFNTSQQNFRIHVNYTGNLPKAVHRSETKPAMVIGTYLRSQMLEPYLQELDYLFSEFQLSERSFYPKLLAAGRVNDKQQLLPVSFNLPMLVFNNEFDGKPANNFLMSPEELKDLAADFDRKNGEIFSAMGFSPRWNPAFILALAQVEGANFREGTPIRWEKLALESSIGTVQAMIAASHGSAQTEDDFKFRYLYVPEYKAVQERRTGFSWMSSKNFFLLPEEQRSRLSFRWLGKNGSIHLEDDTVYAGICRKAKGKDAAEAFLVWLFKAETQLELLESARTSRLMESSFGIAGGLSAIRETNESAFTDYYPSLLGRLPPPDYLQPGQRLPPTWPSIRQSVILPFLLEASSDSAPADLFGSLESRLKTWVRQNPEL